MVKTIRSRNANTILVDAGNALWSEEVPTRQAQSKLMVDAMNLLGYDAMALGELDLSLGVDALRQRIADARFPILSANVQISGTGQLLAQPYALLDVAGEKVGIIGLTWDGAGAQPAVGSAFHILQAEEVLPQYVAELNQKAQVILVLSTMGLEEDKALSQTPGIALFVGGRTRSPMDLAWVNPSTSTRVVQAGSQGQWIGVRRLVFDRQHKLTKFIDNLVYLTEDLEDDPDMAAFLKAYPAP